MTCSAICHFLQNKDNEKHKNKISLIWNNISRGLNIEKQQNKRSIKKYIKLSGSGTQTKIYWGVEDPS